MGRGIWQEGLGAGRSPASVVRVDEQAKVYEVIWVAAVHVMRRHHAATSTSVGSSSPLPVLLTRLDTGYMRTHRTGQPRLGISPCRAPQARALPLAKLRVPSFPLSVSFAGFFGGLIE